MIEATQAPATRIGRWIAVVGVMAVLPLAAWVAQFGQWPMPNDPEQWAFFGTYLSGLLSPLLAFVSFVGLLLTVREQRIAAGLQAQATELQNRRAEGESLVTQIDACLSQAHEVFSSTHWVWETENVRWHQAAELLLIANDLKGQIAGQFPALRARADGVYAHRRFLFSAYLNDPAVRDTLERTSTFRGLDGSSLEIDGRAVKVISDYVKEPRTPRRSGLPPLDAQDVQAISDLFPGARKHYRENLSRAEPADRASGSNER